MKEPKKIGDRISDRLFGVLGKLLCNLEKGKKRIFFATPRKMYKYNSSDFMEVLLIRSGSRSNMDIDPKRDKIIVSLT